MSAFTGPVALAAEVLNVLPFLPAAACAAGVTLCRRAGDLLKERAAFYVALTSLAVAAYFDCASIWFCCTYTFVQGAPPCAALCICHPPSATMLKFLFVNGRAASRHRRYD